MVNSGDGKGAAWFMLRRIVYYCCHGVGELLSAMVGAMIFLDFGRRGAQSEAVSKN